MPSSKRLLKVFAAFILLVGIGIGIYYLYMYLKPTEAAPAFGPDLPTGGRFAIATRLKDANENPLTNYWQLIYIFDTTSTAANYAICYNPRGANGNEPIATTFPSISDTRFFYNSPYKQGDTIYKKFSTKSITLASDDYNNFNNV